MKTDVLVGADGAWSRVRPLLSSVVPAYVGTASIETFLFDCDTRHAATANLVGSGAMYALTPGKGIFAHRDPNGVLHTYVTFKKPKESARGRVKDWLPCYLPSLRTARRPLLPVPFMHFLKTSAGIMFQV